LYCPFEECRRTTHCRDTQDLLRAVAGRTGCLDTVLVTLGVSQQLHDKDMGLVTGTCRAPGDRSPDAGGLVAVQSSRCLARSCGTQDRSPSPLWYLREVLGMAHPEFPHMIFGLYSGADCPLAGAALQSRVSEPGRRGRALYASVDLCAGYCHPIRLGYPLKSVTWPQASGATVQDGPSLLCSTCGRASAGEERYQVSLVRCVRVESRPCQAIIVAASGPVIES
jgi:hypothetical protein